MKSLKLRPLGGLYFALLFIFAVSLVIISIIEGNDIYVAYAILVSCFQFYLYEKLKLSRFFFESDEIVFENAEEHMQMVSSDTARYNVHLN